MTDDTIDAAVPAIEAAHRAANVAEQAALAVLKAWPSDALATTTLELVRAAREVASVLRDAIDPLPTAFTAWAEGNDNSGESREE